MGEWRDIATAPKDGTVVLLYYRYARSSRYVAGGLWRDGRWATPHDPMVRATHWMPLPAPPGEGRELRDGIAEIALRGNESKPSAGNKLWLISQDVNNDYDTYDSAVVVAEREEDARLIHPGGYRWNGKDAFLAGRADGSVYECRDDWAEPGKVRVALIGLACGALNAGEIVCASFNAS